MKTFDMHKYSDDQIKDAFTCPVNRHCTRVEHDCNDWDLYNHPEWLLDHYIRCGGAKEFAKRRVHRKYWVKQEKKFKETVIKVVTHPVRCRTIILRSIRDFFSKVLSKFSKLFFKQS